MEKKPLEKQPPVQQKDALQPGTSQQPPTFQLKAGDEKEKKPDLPYTQHAIAGGAVTIPKDAKGGMPVAVIYGGLVDRGGSYKNMMKWTPQQYFSSHVLIFADHDYGYKGVKASAEKVFKAQGIAPNYRALLGFSAGGMTAANARNAESWGLIGMIDPAINGNFKDFSTPVYMVWDFWGGKPQYTKARKKHNSDLHTGWLVEEKARKEEEMKMGTKIEGRPRPAEVTNPDVFDSSNKDPRYTIHKAIKGGGLYEAEYLKGAKEDNGGKVPGDSIHLPDTGHLGMPAAWFSRFGGNL